MNVGTKRTKSSKRRSGAEVRTAGKGGGGSAADAMRARNGENTSATERGAAKKRGNGALTADDERQAAKLKRGNGRGGMKRDTGNQPAQEKGSDTGPETEMSCDSLCRSLQSLERQRRFALKQCIRGENAITAFVAWNACGFHTGLSSEAEREKLWKQAGKLIKAIDSGDSSDVAEGKDAAEDDSTHVAESRRVNGDAATDTVLASASDEVRPATDVEAVTGVVRISQISRGAWADYQKALIAKMEELAGQLPVASWLDHPDQRGISLGMLATIVGESGNLSNYPNPAKLWRRLFGAPITKGDKTMMPSRWRLEGGLSSEDWEKAGYSPQRHATMQQMKENIVRQNGEGPYRRRYDEAKERTRTTHPEWWQCSKCKGTGKSEKKKCQNCKGTGEVALHAHRHAQLLAAKRFVRELWNQWHGKAFDPERGRVARKWV